MRNGFERFDAERMAGRVLGMGDVVSLVEDVRKAVDLKSAEKLAKKIQSGDRFDLDDFKAKKIQSGDRFDLDDFKEQIGQMRRMGGISGLIDKLPAQLAAAAGQVSDKDADRQVRRIEGIINSMTPAERAKPELLKASRKRRIAVGSGVPVQEVNRLLSQFEQMRSMMKQMKKGGLAKMMRAMGGLAGLRGGPSGPPRR